jgi:hypothetical protein
MTLNNFSSLLIRYGKYLVAAAWLISTLIYLNIHGIVTTLEAGKYIEEAHRFIDNGDFSAPRYYFYCVTLFIMVFAIKIKIGMTGAFIIQAILNLFAFLIFHKALNKLFRNPATPLLIIVYLLAFYPYQSWVVFLYTESAFFSSTLILFSILVLYKPDKPGNILLMALALLFTIISRPLGILYGIAVYLYLFHHAGRKWKFAMAAGSVIMLIIGYYLVNIAFSSVKDWTITQGFEQESIICDMPAAPPYQTLDLDKSGTPVYQLWYYVSHNFSHFLHFAGVKAKYFFLMTRPYYSNGHNYFLLLNVIPVYLLVVSGFFIRGLKFNKSISIFLLSSILIYALSIIFQCDDYHSRFVMAIYPFFVILAARAAEHFILLRFKHNE